MLATGRDRLITNSCNWPRRTYPERTDGQNWRGAQEWYERNRERALEHHRVWYQKNRDRQRRLALERYYQDRDGRRLRMREREARLRAIGQSWEQLHPEEARTRVIRRRARIAGASGSHTTVEWNEKVVLFGGRCAYCGEARPLTRDHRIPLTRGGTNDITNIVPACGLCNSGKCDRTDAEFIALRSA